jgi:hypothetical protein
VGGVSCIIVSLTGILVTRKQQSQIPEGNTARIAIPGSGGFGCHHQYAPPVFPAHFLHHGLRRRRDFALDASFIDLPGLFQLN